MRRPLICECGTCNVCKSRERMRVRRLTHGDHVRALERARYARDRDKRNAANREYRQRPEAKAAHNESAKAWAQRNRDKRAAQVAVGNAVRDGRLVRQPCGVCGNPDTEAHHDDYSKPYDVRWLCREHHRALHMEGRI